MSSIEQAVTDPAESNGVGWSEASTVDVLISSLRYGDSIRINGEDSAHVTALVDVVDELPPIIVQEGTMIVIDGVHRVRAAIVRGQSKMKAKIFIGSDAEALVLAVRLNILHGLPLTRSDRLAAALRIIESFPQWSNRMIAKSAGLAPATVAEVRRRSTEQSDQSNARTGSDGRVRPVNGMAGRQRVVEALSRSPMASIRTIASEAGVSLSTAHAVRKSIHSGEDPLIERLRKPSSNVNKRVAGKSSNVDPAFIFETLGKDPSLRFTEFGRNMIRWLRVHHVNGSERDRIAEMVPEHCAGMVADLARAYADTWAALATHLEDRHVKRGS